MGMNGAGGAAKGRSPGGPHRGGEEGRRWRCVEQACDSDGEPAVASAHPPRPPSGPQPRSRGRMSRWVGRGALEFSYLLG